MKRWRVYTLLVAAFLVGSAAPFEKEHIAAAQFSQEEKRYVRLSLRSGYEDVVTNFKIDEEILPVSLARMFRDLHTDPEMVVDVCEFRLTPEGVYELTACEPHKPEGRP